MPKLEIKAYDVWIPVSPYIFRSWSGLRRKNGKRYRGKVYYLGTRKIYHGKIV